MSNTTNTAAAVDPAAKAQPANDEFAKIPLKEKIAYCACSIALSVFYFLILSLCVFFYTDVIGMSATTIGTIVIVSRFLDFATDLLAGYIIDNTRSRFGKAGGVMMRFVVPMTIFLIIMYMVPAGASTLTKIAYIFVTYNLTVSLGFTFVNTAELTLPSTMSRDQHERSTMFSLMLIMSPVASAIGVSTALPLINFFGNDQRAWIITMAIFSLIGIVLIVTAALTCKERVRYEKIESQEKHSLGTVFKAALSSQFFVCAITSCMQTVFLIGFSTIMTYFSTYFIGDTQFTALLNNVQSYSMAIVSFVMIFATKKFKKSTMVKWGMISAIPGQLIMAIDPTNFTYLFAGILIRSVGFGILTTCVFIMCSDLIDYNFWKSGIRTDGMSTAAQGAGNKLGIMIASGLFPVLMGLSGYNGSLDVQPQSAMNMIYSLFVFVPLIVAVIQFITMHFYTIDKQWDQIQDDLANGRFAPDAPFAPKNTSDTINQ